MPQYESVCLKCGGYHTYFSSVSSRENTPECCGEKTSKRILTAPVGHVDFQPWEPYESPASGKIITSKRERKEDMLRTNTRQWEGREQEEKEAARKRAYEEERLDAELDKTVRTAWANLSPSKKAQALREAGG